ncbi:MAG: 50S ribosomal protein L6 [Porticoccus sp.]|nr:50S ribosomal protein L6 [Porticoccus sp.]
MSRIANEPVKIPSGVEVEIAANEISIKGSKTSLSMLIHNSVDIKQVDNTLTFALKAGSKTSDAMAGTTRALVKNMVLGVTKGFEKKLQLVGVGYRAQLQNKKLSLSLGFSHPVDFILPEAVSAEVPSQTDIILKSPDKQLLGQVAAKIRAFRPPEPYKGKGVRYADEHVHRKEAKKK